MEDLNIYVSFAAMFFAIFLRLYMPYRAAKALAEREGKTLAWDHKYSFSGIGSILATTMIIVALTFIGFPLGDFEHPLIVFLGAFNYAFLQTTIFNQVVDWWRESQGATP